MDFDEFVTFFKRLSERRELSQLFTQYCNGTEDTMDAKVCLIISMAFNSTIDYYKYTFNIEFHVHY